MCQHCLEHFEEIPADLVRILDENEHKLIEIIDAIQPIMQGYIPIDDAFSNVAELEPDHPDYKEAQLQLVQLKKNTTMAYLLGWLSASRAGSSQLATMYLQGSTNFISCGAQDRLAYNHHHMQVKN